jgi:hypothetical protein
MACAQTLTLNGVLIGGTVAISPAWQVKDFSPLHSFVNRGPNNRLIPFQSGRTSYPDRLDHMTVQLPMLIRGDFTSAGAAVTRANWELQILINTAALRTQALLPNAAGVDPDDGTVVAIWTWPNATTLTANVKPRNLTPARDPGAPFVRAVLELNVPAGAFL